VGIGRIVRSPLGSRKTDIAETQAKASVEFFHNPMALEDEILCPNTARSGNLKHTPLQGDRPSLDCDCWTHHFTPAGNNLLELLAAFPGVLSFDRTQQVAQRFQGHGWNRVRDIVGIRKNWGSR
jgi:hypothetical protein